MTENFSQHCGPGIFALGRLGRPLGGHWEGTGRLNGAGQGSPAVGRTLEHTRDPACGVVGEEITVCAGIPLFFRASSRVSAPEWLRTYAEKSDECGVRSPLYEVWVRDSPGSASLTSHIPARGHREIIRWCLIGCSELRTWHFPWHTDPADSSQLPRLNSGLAPLGARRATKTSFIFLQCQCLTLDVRATLLEAGKD